jgi:hypothetical protein
MDVKTFAETHPCSKMLRDKAAELRKRAEQFEALADTLPDWLGSEQIENAMRGLIIGSHG